MRPQGARLNVINLTISSNTDGYNIYNSSPSDQRNRRAIVILTINSGIWLYSGSSTVPALDTGTGWISGTVIKVINNGYIHGCGGNGGNGAVGYQFAVNDFAGTSGSNGGDAINLQWPLVIYNASGRIAGGGGGGGGGGGRPSGSYPNWDAYYYANGGGGGGGQSGPAGAYGGAGIAQQTGTNPGDGASGTTAGAGTGGAAGSEFFAGYGGDGGAGGAWGADGTGGAAAQGSASSGGLGGKAVKRNGYVLTWESLGSVYGSYA